MRSRWIIAGIIAAGGGLVLAEPAAPPGYALSEFAAAPLARNIVCFTLDEQGRVFVAESDRVGHGVADNRHHEHWLLDDLAARTVEDRVRYYRKWQDRVPGGWAWFTNQEDRVRLLLDTDADGRADTSTVFAAGFRAPEEGLGSGLLARDGLVYYTDIPNLWRFADTNHDGRADAQVALHAGFGVRTSLYGHDMHGLVWGPDDRLYWTIGDRGYHVRTHEGRLLAAGGARAAFRCEPDGSNLEVFYYGLRNPQELAFDDAGRLFTVDNNSDAGDRARITYLLEGGDTGWNMRYQTLGGDNTRGPWSQERLWHVAHSNQPAWIVPPVAHLTSGPSGLAFDPGCLPAPWQAGFLICDFRGGSSGSSVTWFQLTPQGAGFALGRHAPLLSDVLATDVEFAPDNRIFVSDWINGWSAEGQGRLLVLQPINEAERAEGRRVAELLRTGFAGRTDADLLAMLADRDYRIRSRAHIELAARRQPAPLIDVLRTATDTRARRHALWALGIQGRRGVAAAWPPLVDTLTAADPILRAEACRMLADGGHVAPALIERIRDPDPHVRALAAIAVGKLRLTAARDALLAAVLENDDRDPWLRHALVMGLAGAVEGGDLQGWTAQPRPAARRAAVLALRRQMDGRVSDFLDDPDDSIVLEAARAIHDLPLPDHLPRLAALVDTYRGVEQALIRRIVHANYTLGAAWRAGAVAGWLVRDPPLPAAMQREVVSALEDWLAPPPRDRVTGEFRRLPDRAEWKAGMGAALEPALRAISARADHPLRAEAIRLATRHGVRLDPAYYRRVVEDGQAGEPERGAALLALAQEPPPDFRAVVDRALAQGPASLRMEARRLLVTLDPVAARPVLVDAVQAAPPAEGAAALQALTGLPAEVAAPELARWLGQMTAGTFPGALQVDLLDAARAVPAPAVETAVAAWRASLPAGDELAPYRLTLTGGDAARGREVFRSDHAMCTKCHKVNGEGGSDAGPDLGGVASRRSAEERLLALVNPNAQLAPGFAAPSAMPPMGPVLSLRELRDVAAYLTSLAGPGASASAHGGSP